MAALALPSLAAAQVPDTLDWRRYFPMEVGNQWQYVGGDGASYWRERIIGDTLINGNRYSTRLMEAGSSPDDLTELVRRTHERYADDGAYVLEARIRPGDSVFTDQWRGDVCAVDAAFNTLGDCPELQARNNVYGGYGGTVEIGGMVVEVAAIKEFDTVGSLVRTAADIGLVEITYEFGATATLEYAVVAGAEYGSPVVATSHDLASGIAHLSSVSVYPMPTRGSVWINVDGVSSAVSIKIINLLGQAVLQRDIDQQGAMSHRIHVDLSALRSGYYMVAAVADRGKPFTTPLVIIR